MLSCPWKSTALVPWIFQAFLLLAASLRAQNQSWDRANCTEGVVSVFRGSCAVMVCNMTNNFSEITIKLTLREETRTIFYKKPPGNFSKGGWQLRNLGGQALLMINEAQAIHAGNYSWKLYGHQPIFRNTFLNVSEPQDQEEATSQRHSVVSSSQGWDRANCTEGVVSVLRGSCAVMVCNMTNNFSEITIKLTVLGEETRTIFYKKPPGNFSKDGWQLRNLGGQALLMINEAQAIHAGQYSWKLYGHQPIFRNTFLNVSDRAPRPGRGHKGKTLRGLQFPRLTSFPQDRREQC